ncbi:hypothetical protein ACW9H6_22415 [Pseudomonas sp. SDO528_S397]
MPRLMLGDEHWSKLLEILLHKAIYKKRDLRMTVHAHGMPLEGLARGIRRLEQGLQAL